MARLHRRLERRLVSKLGIWFSISWICLSTSVLDVFLFFCLVLLITVPFSQGASVFVLTCWQHLWKLSFVDLDEDFAKPIFTWVLISVAEGATSVTFCLNLSDFLNLFWYEVFLHLFLFSNLSIFFKSYLFCMYVDVCKLRYTCGAQRRTWGSCFSSSTMRDLWITLKC